MGSIKYLNYLLGLCLFLVANCGKNSADIEAEGVPRQDTTQEQELPTTQKQPVAKIQDEPDLGVIWSTWQADGYDNPKDHIQKMKKEGFQLVCMVPAYGCQSLEQIDHTNVPTFVAQKKALKALLKNGFSIIYRPHLDSIKYFGNYRQSVTDNHSWVAGSDWRGMFDIDPMMKAYKDDILLQGLKMIRETLGELGSQQTFGKIRFDLGAELMNSVVFRTDKWVELQRAIRASDEYTAIKDKVLLSHNFSHHFQIPQDFIRRMENSSLKSLGVYLRELDAMSVSQYMDLTIFAAHSADQKKPLPTPTEVAKALRHHEDRLVKDILMGALKMQADEIPTIHIGEFGIGLGGLRHPNLWDGDPDIRHAIEATRGFEGLVKHLRGPADKRVAKSAVLWVGGGCFDIFGWRNSKYRIPIAAETIRAYLSSPKSL
jgi:hypothetical protein